MSSDDAIFMQRNKAGQWVAQWGSMSANEPPDPEKALPTAVFERLEDAILAKVSAAQETEYSFQFPRLPEDSSVPLFSMDDWVPSDM